MMAVPAAFAPIPFSLVGIAILVLALGSEMAAPVFVSVFFSFMTVRAVGVTIKIRILTGVFWQIKGLWNRSHSGTRLPGSTETG